MNKRKLLKVADFLDTVVADLPPEKFNMAGWGQPFKANAKAKDYACQTSACVAGWATAIPEFRKAGLKIVRLKPSRSGTQMAFGDLRGESAVAKFFGFTKNEEEALAGIIYGPWDTPHQAAVAIRLLVCGAGGKVKDIRA